MSEINATPLDQSIDSGRGSGVGADRTAAPDSAGESVRGTGQLARAWGRFRRNKLAVVSLVVVAALVLVAALAPLLAPYDYSAPDYNELLRGPSAQHWLGTDQLGRDILTRLMYGLRTALLVSGGAILLALIIATLIGMTAAMMGGRIDNALMAITDTMFAFPMYLLTIIMVTTLGRNLLVIATAIGVASWVTLARLIRAEVQGQLVRDYAEAGRAMGASRWTIATRYVLPNITGPIVVALSFGIPAGITAESGLGILGLGVQPPTASWGTMINEGTQYLLTDTNLILWPTLLFAISVLAFTWVGDGLREAFDVSSEGR